MTYIKLFNFHNGDFDVVQIPCLLLGCVFLDAVLSTGTPSEKRWSSAAHNDSSVSISVVDYRRKCLQSHLLQQIPPISVGSLPVRNPSAVTVGPNLPQPISAASSTLWYLTPDSTPRRSSQLALSAVCWGGSSADTKNVVMLISWPEGISPTVWSSISCE